MVKWQCKGRIRSIKVLQMYHRISDYVFGKVKVTVESVSMILKSI